MNVLRTLLATLFAIFLSQCYYTPQMGGGIYTPQQSAYRSDMREQSRSMNQAIYEQGARSGEADRRAGLAPDHHRYARLFNRATEPAFSQGYNDAFRQGRAPYSQPGGRGYSQSHPGTGAPAYPSTTPPAANDTSGRMYSQGYDFGMRDRAARRPRDPDAHTTALDPWSRQAFERGYLDAFNATPNR